VSALARNLREALQGHLAADDDLGVLRKYVIVAEWTDGDGNEWITRTAGDLNDEAPSVWSVKGMLWHALETVQRDADAED
jgi:hypothetical protein